MTDEKKEIESKVGDDSMKGIHGDGKAPVTSLVEGLQEKPALPPEKLKKNSRKRLTEEQVRAMSPAEVRAVGGDRGYKIGFGGRGAVYASFLAAQEADESLEASEK